MKTSKEFFERLSSDELFMQEVEDKIRARIDAGEQDYKKLWIPVAAEYGYELDEKELENRYQIMASEISEEELGKTAGGTTPALIFTSTLIMSTMYSLKVTVESANKGCM